MHGALKVLVILGSEWKLGGRVMGGWLLACEVYCADDFLKAFFSSILSSLLI